MPMVDQHESLSAGLSNSESGFSVLNSFSPELDMMSPQFNDFSLQSSSHHASSTFDDFKPLSPTMSDADILFLESHGASGGSMHVNPMWNGSESIAHKPVAPAVTSGSNQKVQTLGRLRTACGASAFHTLGQITPPEDTDTITTSILGTKRADSGFGGSEGSESRHVRKRSYGDSEPSKRRRESNVSDDGQPEEIGGDKREKYREKNRVAAAKCRAKKKEHTDHLEDNHRTQSMLNNALKQTEKQLRDELSFWRTQALQHTFCSCRAIQDYNMRKAQNLAAESSFGPMTRRSTPGNHSTSKASPASQSCGVHGFMAQGSTQGSPTLSGLASSRSFATPSPQYSIPQTMHASGDGAGFELMPNSQTFPKVEDQDLESFVDDMTE